MVIINMCIVFSKHSPTIWKLCQGRIPRILTPSFQWLLAVRSLHWKMWSSPDVSIHPVYYAHQQDFKHLKYWIFSCAEFHKCLLLESPTVDEPHSWKPVLARKTTWASLQQSMQLLQNSYGEESPHDTEQYLIHNTRLPSMSWHLGFEKMLQNGRGWMWNAVYR